MTALKGIKVLDFCRTSPGQAACSTLGDMGADVIHVGEPTYTERRGWKGLFAVGRNKRSILVNLQSREGKDIIFKMARVADVMVESYRPGVAERLGIGYEAIKRVKSDIVYCSLSGFGQTGPYRDVPAHDINYQGVGGMLPKDAKGRPMFPSSNWADRLACVNLTVAILSALLARERQGIGQYVDTSYLDAAVTIPSEESRKNVNVHMLPLGGPPAGEAYGKFATVGEQPGYNIYAARDGKYLSLGIKEPWFWERLCKYFGKSEWAPHQDPKGRLRIEMFAFFRKAFMQKDRDEWIRILTQEVDTQAAPVNVGYEVMDDAHLRTLKAIVSVDGPERQVRQAAVPYRFSATPGSIWRGVTLAGQDTSAIMKELGYADEETRKLIESGVVRAL